MIFPVIASVFLIIAVICFLNLTPQQITDDINSVISKKPNLRDRARSLRSGKKKKGLGARLSYLQSALKACGKESKFAVVCSSALILFAVGAVAAVLINNFFLIPAFSVAFAMIPFIYVKNITSIYERQTKEELETTLSIITTSYVRSDDVVSAIQENLPYIRPPLKDCFTAFIGDALAVSSNIKRAIKKLKEKIDDEIFQEWCDTLIQCQDNREMKDTLQPVVAKLTDVRIVNNELNTMMSAVRTEYYTMVGLVIGNVPLLYVLNKDWFHTLIYETSGKMALGVCGIVIVITYFFMLKFTKPVEFKR